MALNLSGASLSLKGKVAMWDEGIAYAAHQEFGGKSILTIDGSTTVADHATHVAGTMIAKGVNPRARGMVFGLTSLYSNDFNNDQAEMAAMADGLLISNHSYGYEAGWNCNTSERRWEWEGLPGDTVDYKFGFYSVDAQTYDKIAFNAPQYLIIQSAGNSHSETGPNVGDTYYGYDSRDNATLVNKGPRPTNISKNNGYDVISGTAVGKMY